MARIKEEYRSESRIRRFVLQILKKYVYGYNEEEAMEEASQMLSTAKTHSV